MRKLLKLVLPVLFCAINSASFAQQQPSTFNDIQEKNFDPANLLWYAAPATNWNDAIPLGTGRLGAMVFGDPFNERIQFNEETYWSGGPYSSVVKGGHQYLPELQELVFKGEWYEAQKLFGRKMMGYPVEQQKYQSLADLVLKFEHVEKYKNYKRWLDLSTSILNVQYEADGIQYHREIFASIPDQAIVMRISADKKNSLSFSASLKGVRNQDHSNYATDYFKMDVKNNNELVLTGKSADYLGVAGQLKYEARIKAVAEDGSVSTKEDYLQIKNASSVTFYFVAATNFKNYKEVNADEHERVQNYFKGFAQKSFEQIKTDQVSKYQEYFKRASLKLAVSPASYASTDERLKNNVQQYDPALSALAYHFGRYVLITCSLPGTQAANLQGIWNQDQDPMWDSKYTTNINLQMSYWMAASSNLADCAEPLYQLVKNVTDQGAQVAKENYGCRGWVLHQNTDLWMVAAPMDGPTWGTFTTGGAWLCNQLWDQYLYTNDHEYLKKIYPLIKGSVEFFMDFLVKQPDSKWYVTNPSSSPENFPNRPGNGQFFDEVTGSFIPGTNICAGSSIDMQIIKELFTAYIDAAKLLQADKNFAAEVLNKKNLLLPPQIGKDGSLQEWAQDWGQTENPHRHLSGLYGLYPGNEFTFSATPQLMDACKAVLLQRGDESSEWSRAWKVCLWTRMKDGDHALKILKGYYKDECHSQFLSGRGKVMQIDGTMGVAAGISEMLVQSHENSINLLPALPGEWKEGTLMGVRARGGFVLDLTWSKNKIKTVKIISGAGGKCRLNAGIKGSVLHNGKKVKTQSKPDGSIEWPTIAGETYQFNS
ncbi:MAG: glycoside hydrolase family 95 protein [Ginsengibacter sp.]